MCVWSLVVSVLGLAVYVALIAMSPSGSAFVRGTGLALVVSFASLVLGILGWRRESRRWLRVLSIAVAAAFVLTMGIMALNILVYSRR